MAYDPKARRIDAQKDSLMKGVMLKADFADQIRKGNIVYADTGEVAGMTDVVIRRMTIQGFRKFGRSLYDPVFAKYMLAALEPVDFMVLFTLPYVSKFGGYALPKNWKWLVTEACGMSHSSVRKSCKRLEEAGLVFRTEDGDFRNPYGLMRGRISPEIFRLSTAWYFSLLEHAKYEPKRAEVNLVMATHALSSPETFISYIKNYAKGKGPNDQGEDGAQPDSGDGSGEKGGEDGDGHSGEGQLSGPDGLGGGGEGGLGGIAGPEAV